MGTKTVVELDLVGYSDVARTVEENVGVGVVLRLNQQIQQFVDEGLTAVGAKREEVVLATAGDNAIVAFNGAAEAHRFASAVHHSAEAHNAKLTVPSAKRWFRIGIASGELYEQRRPDGGREIAGTVIANAVRLEAAAYPGQIVADAATFKSLPANLRKLYGPAEVVRGKRNEEFAAHRCAVLVHSAPQGAPATLESVLDLFDRLNPRDQSQSLSGDKNGRCKHFMATIHSVLDLFDRLNPPDQLGRVMIVLEMPEQFRPSRTLSLAEQQNKIIDWVKGSGGPGLKRLADVLGKLIEVQEPSPPGRMHLLRDSFDHLIEHHTRLFAGREEIIQDIIEYIAREPAG